ncbi:hypothetical protein CPB84DRAFT_1893261 [Gymnopilus junonius]|uniref:Uncharacterized protein n=1 Tax=Gymnopilus junonius TaxID=109634 RepID=A0A9P5NTA2_GYMJU|nr:hypothetical protein CPB84DRAFT_1893261 [Gymnopilus junonius]
MLSWSRRLSIFVFPHASSLSLSGEEQGFGGLDCSYGETIAVDEGEDRGELVNFEVETENWAIKLAETLSPNHYVRESHHVDGFKCSFRARAIGENQTHGGEHPTRACGDEHPNHAHCENCGESPRHDDGHLIRVCDGNQSHGGEPPIHAHCGSCGGSLNHGGEHLAHVCDENQNRSSKPPSRAHCESCGGNPSHGGVYLTHVGDESQNHGGGPLSHVHFGSCDENRSHDGKHPIRVCGENRNHVGGLPNRARSSNCEKHDGNLSHAYELQGHVHCATNDVVHKTTYGESMSRQDGSEDEGDEARSSSARINAASYLVDAGGGGMAGCQGFQGLKKPNYKSLCLEALCLLVDGRECRSRLAYEWDGAALAAFCRLRVLLVTVGRSSGEIEGRKGPPTPCRAEMGESQNTTRAQLPPIVCGLLRMDALEITLMSCSRGGWLLRTTTNDGAGANQGLQKRIVELGCLGCRKRSFESLEGAAEDKVVAQCESKGVGKRFRAVWVLVAALNGREERPLDSG